MHSNDLDDDDFETELDEFLSLNEELYPSVLPMPDSRVAVYEALADRLELLGPDRVMTEDLRKFVGAIVVRCAQTADMAPPGTQPGEAILRQLLPESLAQARATMAAYNKELEEELRNTGGGRV